MMTIIDIKSMMRINEGANYDNNNNSNNNNNNNNNDNNDNDNDNNNYNIETTHQTFNYY